MAQPGKLGVDFKGFVAAIGWFNYKLLEPLLPRGIHLANIACIEHLNAYLGDFYLQRDLLKNSDPKMKRLFYWHFAEEIEHQRVAFDVFEHLYGSYFLRVIGAFLVITLFFAINTGGTLYFLWQDKCLFRSSTSRECWNFMIKESALINSLRNTLDYLRPAFNPAQKNNYRLAKRFLSDPDNKKSFKICPTP